jgi:hypothetical protein
VLPSHNFCLESQGINFAGHGLSPRTFRASGRVPIDPADIRCGSQRVKTGWKP